MSDDAKAMSEWITAVTRELGDVPLIGFAGAPFTVATYAIEGKTGKTFADTKRLLYERPDDARRLLAVIADATVSALEKARDAAFDF